jgi:16S rRNA (adenine1518-N6/adenine1519-N6)-dimethyltransferase
MTYSSRKELIRILNKEGLYADKRLGQNFLTCNGALKKIIETAEIRKGELVYEIGPGLGFLTQALLNAGAKVHAIEVDRKIAQYLKKHFEKNKNFELEKGNVLKASLPKSPYKLVANIPFNITSPILRYFLQASSSRPALIVLLVQKEVAEKICAKEGSHSMISLQTQIFGKPQIIAKVGKNKFYPPPKVDSAILKIETYREPLIRDTEKFFSLISKAFTQKRKMLGKIIKSTTFSQKRPQELSIEDWKTLIEEQN